MDPVFERPRAMRSRLTRSAQATIADQILDPAAPVTKRIAQPKGVDHAAHIPQIRDWLDTWKAEADRVSGRHLDTTRKSSGGLRLAVPSSLTFPDLFDYASWLGAARDLHKTTARLAELQAFDDRLAGMARSWRLLDQLSDSDFLSFSALLRWRHTHPQSHPPVRALAIPGLDTKWIERNKALVRNAFSLIGAFDDTAETDLAQLGFDTTDRMTVWFRFGTSIGGVAALVPQLALRPSESSLAHFPGATRAIVIENQTSFETIDLGPHDLAIFGQGGQAPAALGLMPWLADLEDILYWGDMDGEGYRILARGRQALPDLKSLLMDGDTAAELMNTISVEVPKDTRPAPEDLTQSEASGYALTAGQGRRIEQERIPTNLVQDDLTATRG